MEKKRASKSNNNSTNNNNWAFELVKKDSHLHEISSFN